MGSLDNNIRLIRNETVEGGNTKERIAETFELLVTELESKVNKVPGKKLSTEDFTTELRTKLEGLQQVDTSGLLPKGGYTGTAQDLKNLIDNINRILQSDDTDLDQLQEIVNYIKQNKHILSTLGISNIAGLVDALAAKADKDHHHDDRYAPITHHHNEYALRTHRHNWDDIDGKPNNLATTDNVKTAIEGIQIGGRNLILNSKQKITNDKYNVAEYDFVEGLKEGDIVILSVKAQLGNPGSWLEVYNGGIFLTSLTIINGVFVSTFSWKTNPSTSKLIIYVLSQNGTNNTIEWVKLERGNKPTDWSPAPEDLVTNEEVMRKITRTGYEVSTDTVIPQAQQNDTVFVKASCTLGLQNIEHLGSLSLIKTFDTGAVTFTCAGKNIIYPFDNTFNGKKGSTAVVSIHNNDCYIRISNV